MLFKKKTSILFLSIISFFILIVSNAYCNIDLTGKTAGPIKIRKWITSHNPDLDTLDSRVYLLDFWATWCGPCIRSIPEINRIHDKYKTKGLVVIGMNCDKSPGKVPKAVKKNKIQYYVALDAGTAKMYQVDSYPTLIAIDSSGTIIWHGHHPDNRLFEAIEIALENAPSFIIKDIELGPFEAFRQYLCGGKKFALAMRKLDSVASKGNEQSQTAKEIIETVKDRIDAEITKALEIKESDPVEALRRLDRICSLYNGIDAVQPAKQACLELKGYSDKL